jgi:hypothetical protein
MLVYIIVYDLQSRKTICFNIQSVAAFKIENPSSNGRLNTLLDRVALSLFNKSVNEKMEFKSYLPLPIYSEWYTPLPWLTYLALQPIPMKHTNTTPEQRSITIPEFLTFGCAEDYHIKNSFHLERFSKETSGHATCVLNFKDGNRSLQYVLRLDQWSGDTFIHIDYSIYDPTEQKFIEHHPLDLEMIYQFSSDLFVAILSAAVFDANFSTIVEKGLKGVAELRAKNSVYFYAFKHIFMLERALEWFDEKPDRYEVLRKVSSGEQLSDEEKDEVDYMHNNFLGIIARERGRQGVGLMGDAILFRLDRNQRNVRVSK